MAPVSEPWSKDAGNGPIVATAIHNGHDLRPEVATYMALSGQERLHEEDPFTGDWTTIGDSRIVVNRSRFEVDLNRPPHNAVYRKPEDAWGLEVWWDELPEEAAQESHGLHARFYEELRELLTAAGREHERIVVLDLHSYNHRRGPGHEPEDPAENPDINLGTESIDRSRWGPLVDRFRADLAACEVAGRQLDVRENVKFQGAHLVRWVNSTFPNACAIAIEVKKIFMDEVTGILHEPVWRAIHQALEGAAAGCRDQLRPVTLPDLDNALDIDRILCEVALGVDFLLSVTPVNVPQEWRRFHAAGYRTTPRFEYRALSPDLPKLQERLDTVDPEQAGDPVLSTLFASKLNELRSQLECLALRNQPEFLQASIRLYGGVEPALKDLAESILDRCSARPRPRASVNGDRVVGARTFARRAQIELDRYREVQPGLTSKVKVLEEVPGIMAFEGDLLIGREVKVPADRVEALIQHEVGTHVVTFANGAAHRLGLFQVGLAGYEETQEALAVFAEYVVGGLTEARLAQLAARVVAVDRLLQGDGFTEVFNRLRRGGLRPHAAFHVTARVFRAGGLTKDAIYLRGIAGLVDHLQAGGELEPLFAGKLPIGATEVLPHLVALGMVQKPPHRPRWADVPDAEQRIDAVRRGLSVVELANREAA